MTIQDTKEAIAAAVDGVAGVTGYATKPAVLVEGDAYVRWRGWARADGQAFTATYAVIVVLPQDGEEAADGWAYEHADLLTDALRPVMYVDTVEPSLIPVEGAVGAGMFALTITGRSE